MSILEPRRAETVDDPLLDAAVGLYSYAHRVRDVLERIAPPTDHHTDHAATDSFTDLLLGLVATAIVIEREIGAARREDPEMRGTVSTSSRVTPGGSLWR